MTQFINFFINGRIFFNVGIRNRQISFRLIVIIVADKIFHGIFGEESFKLFIQLRR